LIREEHFDIEDNACLKLADMNESTAKLYNSSYYVSL